MSERWRWEAVVPLVCVVCLVPWVYVTWSKVTNLNVQPVWLVILCAVLGIGLGCGVVGTRRGRRASRVLAGVCLVLLGATAVAFIALMRLDPRINP